MKNPHFLVPMTLFAAYFLCSPRVLVAQEECMRLNDSMELYISTGQFPRAIAITQRLLEVCEKGVGKEHLEYADALVNKAQVLILLQGDYKNGLKLCLAADTIFIINKATETKGYGALLGVLGAAWHYVGDYVQAEKSCREAVRIAEATSDFAVLGNRYNSLGVILFQQGKYDEAFSLIERALQLLEKQQSKSSLFYLVSALNYSVMLGKAGKYQAQYSLMKEIFPIADSVLAQHLYRGMFWTAWGESNLVVGEYVEALRILRMAKEIQLKTVGDQHLEYAKVLNALAMTLRQVGQYSKALPLQEEAVGLMKKTAGLSNPITLTGIGNLTVLYVEIGEVERAFTLYEQLLRDMRVQLGEKNFDCLNQQINYTSFLYENGFLHKAAVEAREAERIYRTSYDTLTVLYGRALSNLGVVYANLKQLDSALMFQTRALRIYEKTLGTKSLEYASTLYGLAYDYQQLGEIDTALALSKQALIILRENDPGSTMLASRVLMHLVELSFNQRRYLEALGYAEEALLLAQKNTGVLNHDYPVIIGRKGRVQEMTGQLPQAFAAFQKAVLLSRERIAQIAGIYSYGGDEVFAQRMLPVFENYASFVHRHPKYQKQAAGVLFDNALTLDQLLLQQSRTAIQAARSSADTAVAAQVRDWNNLKQLWAYQSNLPKPQYNLDNLNRDIERIEQQLTATFLPLKQAREKVSWQKVQSALAPGDAVVQFISFPASESADADIVYYALLLRPGYPQPKMISLCRENQLTALLDQKAISAKGLINKIYPYSTKDWPNKQRYSKLYNLIWEPLEKHLRGVRRVYYSPAGQLHQIAFPAVVKKPGDLLVDHFNLQYVSSARDLVLHNDLLPSKSIRTAQVFGGVRYETDAAEMRNTANRSTPDFLPATLREMHWVDSVLHAHGILSDTFSGYDAHEGRIKRYCTDSLHAPDLFHIGTHGYYFPAPEKSSNIDKTGYKWADNPMFRSCLLMAGGMSKHLGKMPLGGFDDGLLSAYEIASLNLYNTKLVVLSACQSGLGDVHNNEGVYGLQRAFKVAGVQHLLVTLWPVDDAATRYFMEQFYTHWIVGGKDIRAAFTQAQTDVRSMPKWADPYFWAGFVLM